MDYASAERQRMEGPWRREMLPLSSQAHLATFTPTDLHPPSTLFLQTALSRQMWHCWRVPPCT